MIILDWTEQFTTKQQVRITKCKEEYKDADTWKLTNAVIIAKMAAELDAYETIIDGMQRDEGWGRHGWQGKLR